MIERTEVDRAIQRLRKHKATFLDSIPNEALVALHAAQLGLLTDLFNIILKRGFFPTEWSLAYLRPLYKKGTTEPQNGKYNA